MVVMYCDVETTGLTARHGIFQLSGRFEVDGVEASAFDYRMRPVRGDLLAKKALEVTGVSREELENYACPVETYNEFFATIRSYVNPVQKDSPKKEKITVKGWYVGFDENMLRAWFGKVGTSFFGAVFYSPTICIAQRFALYLELTSRRHEARLMKLGAVGKFLGLDMTKYKLHDSKDDIALTIAIDKMIDVRFAEYYGELA